MSHIEEGKSTLAFTNLAALLAQGDRAAFQQHPSLALLRQAVTLVAQAHGGSLGTTYQDYYGRSLTTNTGLALVIPGQLPRGIGLVIDEQTGQLSFKGDPWDHRPFFAEVQKLIVQHYVVLAYGAALRRMNAQVSTQTVEQHVVVTGVFRG